MPPKEYEIVTAIVIAIIVFLLAGFFILVLVVYYNQRKKKHILEKQAMQSLFHQELLQTQLEIQEQTFKIISQEIHDNIGQMLSLIKLNINTLNIDETEIAEKKISLSNTLLTKVIQDMRDLSKMLNTDFISEIGLVTAIEQQVNILTRSGVYATTFEITGEQEKYELQRELVLFRIVQEILNNIVKHASATDICVRIMYRHEKLIISISDNGKGFDLQKVTLGMGLRNMQNRIALIGGALHINSDITGTTVAVELFSHPIF